MATQHGPLLQDIQPFASFLLAVEQPADKMVEVEVEVVEDSLTSHSQ
jgi:hypothetical protein